MKRTFVGILTIGLIAPALLAQEQRQTSKHDLELLAQGLTRVAPRAAIETRITTGKPYSGEAVTEFVQLLGDGNRIVRKSSERQYRDSEGRTRREQGADTERNTIVITDPVAGTSYILNPETRVATKSPAAFARVQTTQRVAGSGARGGGEPRVEVFTVPKAEIERAAETSARAAEAAATIAMAGARSGQVATFAVGAGGGVVASTTAGGERQDLGQQVIEGVTANGTRTTTVIAAGTVGNDQPITVVAEQWFSPDLGVLVLTRHSDPRVGETTYRLINISRSEPDPSLFQVPSDYTVQVRLPSAMLRKQQQ